MRVTTNLDSLNPSVSRADFFILRGTCKTRCYIIKKQGQSRCFNDQKCVIFLQPHDNLYYVTSSNLIVSTMMVIMDTAEDMYSL